jgi:hypothetical protein
MDDERLRAFVREELDRREAEAQKLCLHVEASIPPGCDINTIRCNACGKIIDESDLDGPGSESPPPAQVKNWHEVSA